MAEHGNGWKIEREVISVSLASLACGEISLLRDWATGSGDGIVTTGTVRGKGISGFNCRVEPLTTDPAVDCLQNHEGMLVRLPALLQLFQMRRTAIGSSVPGFTIVTLEEDGLVTPHRDAYLLPSSATTIKGIGRASIEDPVTRSSHDFDLPVGDAFVLQNPPHPKHGVQNIGTGQRVAFVI